MTNPLDEPLRTARLPIDFDPQHLTITPALTVEACNGDLVLFASWMGLRWMGSVTPPRRVFRAYAWLHDQYQRRGMALYCRLNLKPLAPTMGEIGPEAPEDMGLSDVLTEGK